MRNMVSAKRKRGQPHETTARLPGVEEEEKAAAEGGQEKDSFTMLQQTAEAAKAVPSPSPNRTRRRRTAGL